MATLLRVLIAEDRPTDAELLIYELKRAGYEVDWTRVDNEKDYLAHLNTNLDLILADHSMPEFDSGRALELLKEHDIDVPLIVVTGSIGEEKAVDLIRHGASDYLLKDRLARLGEAAKRALEEKRLREERMNAQQALTESEASFKLLFYANPQPMWVYATDTSKFLEVNNAAVSHYGYTREEFLEMTVSSIQLKNSTSKSAAAAGGNEDALVISGESKHNLKNGDLIDVELVSHPLQFSGQNARLEVAHDITARKRAEAALQTQNQRLSALYQVAQVVNSTLDVNRILSYLATESMRMTGATHALVMIADPIKGYFERRSLHGFKPEELKRLENTNLKLDEGLNGRAYKTGQIVLIDDVRTQPEYHELVDGTLSELVIPIIRQGEVLGNIDLESPALAAFADADLDYLRALAEQSAVAITNARLYHELESYGEILEQAVNDRTAELQATKDRVEIILSSVGDGLIVLSLDGRIQQVNPAFERQTGYNSAEAEMKDHHDLLQMEFGSKGDYQAALELLTPGQVWLGETKVRRKDGSTYDASVTIAPVRNGSGKIQLLVASIRDITPLKEVERAKDEFVSNVSHELRTPITSLRLTRDLMKRDPSRLDVFMERLNRDIERLNLLIEDLLRLSRLQQGDSKMNLQQVDLNVLATQYYDDRTPLAENRDLTLKVEVSPDLPAVEADPGLLGQALSVLLTNAFNYTPAGGTVTISTHQRTESGKRWAGFTISDTGPGIPPAERDRLFTRFFRGAVGRASGSPGTGLGLAISKEIVERHTGRIEIVSEGIPGKGTAFEVWLPAKDTITSPQEDS